MNTENVKEQQYFIQILNIIQGLRKSGLIEKGFGQCLSMSDVIMKLLYKAGIESELVECSLMIMCKDPPGLYLVGYPGFQENAYLKDQKIDNHIVCITKTEIPILIDLSITCIDSNIEFICEPILKEEKHADIAEFEFANSTWTYQKRPTTGLPRLHQKSIVHRIENDVRIQKEIKFIKTFLFIMFGVSFLNFSRGLYDFYLTFLNPDTQIIKLEKPHVSSFKK